MRLHNTSRYPTDAVRALVTFGMRGVRTARLEVHVKNVRHGAFRGMAYPEVPAISSAAQRKTVDRLVTIGVGAPDAFPCSATGRYKRAPAIDLRDWRECIVVVAAHEGRHIQQFQREKPRSEVDSERWAARRLAAYRALPRECDFVRECVLGGPRCGTAGDRCCWL